MQIHYSKLENLVISLEKKVLKLSARNRQKNKEESKKIENYVLQLQNNLTEVDEKNFLIKKSITMLLKSIKNSILSKNT